MSEESDGHDITRIWIPLVSPKLQIDATTYIWDDKVCSYDGSLPAYALRF